jgi:hypothetical protein
VMHVCCVHGMSCDVPGLQLTTALCCFE